LCLPPLIIGGRHKNFENWMNIELFNYKNKNFSVSFFFGHSVLYWTRICKTIQNSIPILYQVKSANFKCQTTTLVIF
jgi:hypothetical protein